MDRYSFVKVRFQKQLRLVYKPHSVQRQSACAIISLGNVSPRCSMQPTRGSAETSSLPSSEDDFTPAWPCSRWGLPGRLHYCKRRWSLTPPFHHHHPGAAVCFCGPNPAGFPAPDVIRRRALWSADFPRSRQAEPRLPNQPE